MCQAPCQGFGASVEIRRFSIDRHRPVVEQAVAADLATGQAELYDRIIAAVEKPLIRTVRAATRGNQVKAAERLGLNRNTLRKKILALGLAARDEDDLVGA